MAKATSYENWTIKQLIEKVESNEVFADVNQRNNNLHDTKTCGTIINTVLTPINDVQMITLSLKSNGKFAIADGQQRANDLIKFFKNQFTLSKTSLPDHCKKDYWSKTEESVKFEQLNKTKQTHFLNGIVPIKIVDESKLGHISSDYMFNALNTATVALNGDEVLHGSQYGEYLNFIKLNFENTFLNKIGFITNGKIKRLKPLRPLITLSEQFTFNKLIDGENGNMQLICDSRRNVKITGKLRTSIMDATSLMQTFFSTDELKHLRLYCSTSMFNILIFVLQTYRKHYSIGQTEDIKNALIKLHHDIQGGGIQYDCEQDEYIKRLKVLNLISETRIRKGSLSGICHKQNIARAMFEYMSLESEELNQNLFLIKNIVPTLKMKIQLDN